MKYYAVTEDPRELYHYGVKGMKWGQHIFGPEPGLKKSDAYRKAQQKLKTLSAKASNVAKTSSVKVSKVTKTAGAAIKKSAAQASYNHRVAQQNRFNKAVARSEAKNAKIDAKIDRYFETKPIKDAKRQLAISTAKQNMKNAFRAIGSTAAKTSEQISYNVRRKQQEQYNKAVEKANTRNRLADAMRSYDQDQKLYKQVERDRKIEALQEKKADVMADNDLKTLRKSVRVEKNMPKYYQQARTGMLPYGKLSDEQVERLQNRLALEWNTRRLGSTEKPSWREQKKMARREGYLQGITKGTAAAMEEVARAGVQYGIKNLANRKKLDAVSEYKAEREKQANRIKKQRTNKEIREDIKQDVYENRAKEGTAMFTKGTAKKLREAEANQRLRQNAIDDANAERKFLMDEKHNAARTKRQMLENEEREERQLRIAGERAYKYGYDPTSKKNGGGNNNQQGKKAQAQIGPGADEYFKMKYLDKETLQDVQKREDKKATEQKKIEDRSAKREEKKNNRQTKFNEREAKRQQNLDEKNAALKEANERIEKIAEAAKEARQAQKAEKKEERHTKFVENEAKRQEAYNERQKALAAENERIEKIAEANKRAREAKKNNKNNPKLTDGRKQEQYYDDKSTDWSQVYEALNQEEEKRRRKRG